ncbi:tetratricopeptide repeat protein [Thermoactinomyces mirandus]|uniref:Tetratricopeptide repeat protein n=1 Tax=Thermoactinomyces mirandus TaxID=2756294 RepID=A0A7W1XTP9_9BACL|nr:tetratricopeptide repeat protein [Thermoactinomyces mirandus]MBA4603011.1 tetratricopeptide repeat protein [Thermoactinomyces mirandus]
MSEFKKKGESIQGKYEVLSVFPFVEGVLYYTALKKEGEEVSTRFIHAVTLENKPRESELNELKKRNSEVFFPISDVFMEGNILYQVFERMEGDLLGVYLIRSAPLPMDEVARFLKNITSHLLQCYDDEQFALVDPQNMVIHSEGNIRFLYGGPDRLFGFYRRETEDVKKLAQLLYFMLTKKQIDEKTSQFEPVRSTRPDMSLELESLLKRALSNDAIKRPRIQDFWKWAHNYHVKKPKLLGGKTDGKIVAKPTAVTSEGEFKAPVTMTKKTTATHKVINPPGKGKKINISLPSMNRKTWIRIGGAVAAVLLVMLVFQFFGDSTKDTLAGVIDPTIEEDPQQAFNYFRQSSVAYEQKQLDQAILFGRKALSADLEKKEYFQHLANLYGLKQDYKTGLQVLTAAVDKFPEEGDLYDSLSVFAYYLKDYDLAKEASDQAVSLRKDEAGYYYHNGKIYGALKNYDQAVRSLQFATYLSKRNARYHHDLAIYLFKQGKIDEAIDYAKSAAKYAESSEEEYYVTLGVLYLKKWEQLYNDQNLNQKEKKEELARYAKYAYRAFNDAVDEEYKYPRAQYYRSMAYYLYGYFISANQTAEKAAKYDPANPVYHYQLGLTYMGLEDKERALQAFERAYQLNPNQTLYQDAIKKAQQMKTTPKKKEVKPEDENAK